MSTTSVQLKLLPLDQYAGVNRDDPIRFYSLPVIGRMYRRRVEMCLGECTGGQRVLEVGFGSGVSFLNLHERYREIHGRAPLAPESGPVDGNSQSAASGTNGSSCRRL